MCECEQNTQFRITDEAKSTHQAKKASFLRAFENAPIFNKRCDVFKSPKVLSFDIMNINLQLQQESSSGSRIGLYFRRLTDLTLYEEDVKPVPKSLFGTNIVF